METDHSNCQTRDDLQNRVWDLVTRFHFLTSRLLFLAGKDRQAFAVVSADCVTARADINESRRQLQVHRTEHGC